eukprot:scaffold221676_cov31-Tisochrysis_lutea.AAC.2
MGTLLRPHLHVLHPADPPHVAVGVRKLCGPGQLPLAVPELYLPTCGAQRVARVAERATRGATVCIRAQVHLPRRAALKREPPRAQAEEVGRRAAERHPMRRPTHTHTRSHAGGRREENTEKIRLEGRKK